MASLLIQPRQTTQAETILIPTPTQVAATSTPLVEERLQGWPEYCVEPQEDDTLLIARPAGETVSCLNDQLAVTVEDFSAEWIFELTSGDAILMVAQGGQSYWIALSKKHDLIQLATIQEYGKVWSDLDNGFYYPSESTLTEDGAIHTFRLMRDSDQIAFYLNDELIHQSADTLFKWSTDTWRNWYRGAT